MTVRVQVVVVRLQAGGAAMEVERTRSAVLAQTCGRWDDGGRAWCGVSRPECIGTQQSVVFTYCGAERRFSAKRVVRFEMM